MAGWALGKGNVGFAFFCYAAYQCILRTGEAFGLKVGAATLAPGGREVLFELGLTKGGRRRREKSEHVLSRDPALIKLFLLAREGKAPGDKLYPVTAHCMRQTFARACRELGLSSDMRPYSCRRGGAAAHFQKFGSLSLTTTRGRWANQKTCRLYIDEARVTLQEMRVRPEVNGRLRRACALFAHCLGQDG